MLEFLSVTYNIACIGAREFKRQAESVVNTWHNLLLRVGDWCDREVPGDCLLAGQSADGKIEHLLEFVTVYVARWPATRMLIGMLQKELEKANI